MLPDSNKMMMMMIIIIRLLRQSAASHTYTDNTNEKIQKHKSQRQTEQYFNKSLKHFF